MRPVPSAVRRPQLPSPTPPRARSTEVRSALARSALEHEPPKPGAGMAGHVVPVLVYVVIGVVAALLPLAFGRNPFVTAGWMSAPPAAGALVSLGLGAAVAGGTIAATRVLVKKQRWARALHADLRPYVKSADDVTIGLLAITSALAEELTFRGVLVPLVGVWLAAAAFGVLHQVRGQARFWWMAWAFVMGAVFGGIFELTGSLAGPIVAHVAINWVNLRFLRDRDFQAAPKPRALGGLLTR